MPTCIYMYTLMHMYASVFWQIYIYEYKLHTYRSMYTHTHMSTCTHLHTCFLNICLSHHPFSSFVFSFTHSLPPALLPCLRDALDGSRQFSLHHGSLFMMSFFFMTFHKSFYPYGWSNLHFQAVLGGPPSLLPTLFMGTCPCPQSQAVKLYHHLFFHLSINVTRSVLTRSIENYKTSNTPYQPCYCKPWGMLGQ